MRAFSICAGYRFVQRMADSQRPYASSATVGMTLRSIGAMAAVVGFVTSTGVGIAGAPQATRSVQPPETGPSAPAAGLPDTSRAAVFLTLPMARGFADATHALVDAQEIVRKALTAVGEVRLVDRSQDAHVVLTVLGRGRGELELTAALRALDSDVISPPVAIGTTERYIEVMLTVGSCRERATAADVDGQRPRSSCYSRVFVGLGFSDLDGRRPAKRPPLNSWEACAGAVARDVRAWLAENASRIRAHSAT